MVELFTWDLAGRVGIVDFRGFQTEVTKFDNRGESAVIYEKNGATIRS